MVEKVFDIAIDPIDNSLVALLKGKMYMAFQGLSTPINFNAGTHLENDTIEAKIVIQGKNTI